MSGFGIEDARSLVAVGIVIFSAIMLLFWFGSTGFNPTPEQAAEHMADQVVPLPFSIIAWVSQNLGSTTIGALVLLALILFFFGGKKR